MDRVTAAATILILTTSFSPVVSVLATLARPGCNWVRTASAMRCMTGGRGSHGAAQLAAPGSDKSRSLGCPRVQSQRACLCTRGVTTSHGRHGDRRLHGGPLRQDTEGEIIKVLQNIMIQDTEYIIMSF